MMYINDMRCHLAEPNTCRARRIAMDHALRICLALHGDALDEDIFVAGLLAGQPDLSRRRNQQQAV